MATTLPEHYGSEKTKFPVPGLKGTKGAKDKYFVLVDEKTGEKKIYKNNNLTSDRPVGTIDKDNNFVPEGDAKDYELTYFNSKEGKKLINNHGNEVAYQGLLQNGEGLDPDEARKKANELVNTNDAKEEVKLSESVNSLRSEPADKNTTNQFPTADTLFYPENLRKKLQDVIKFSMMKYEPKDVPKGLKFKDRDQSRRSIGSCILPIPGGIADGNSVSWNQENMNPVDIAKAEFALRTIRDGSEGFTGSVADIAGALGGTGKDTIATLLAQAASGTGNQLLTRTTGSVLNPNMELLFQGPALRDFTFQFKLSPRSSKEAKKIIQIIRFFKQGMAPIRSQSRLFLKSPHTFKLQYLHDNDDH